jgi:hypothetical protein
MKSTMLPVRDPQLTRLSLLCPLQAWMQGASVWERFSGSGLDFNPWVSRGTMRTITVLLLTISLASAANVAGNLASATKVTGDERKTVVWRNNTIIAAFTDGWLCYGVKEPRSAQCHRAMPKPAYPEIR